jgi:Ca-activated chloride channel homolog
MQSGISALVFSLLSLGGFGQIINGNDFASHSTAPTIRKLVQEVDLTFTITNRRGRLIRDLNLEQIAVLDNGESPQEITYFEARARLPLRLAIVIDTSDSVISVLKSEERAAQDFLKGILRPATDVGMVISFSKDVQVTQEPTQEIHRLTSALRKLPAGGKTAIYDAVAVAAGRLAKIPDSQPSLRAIILLTDGDDNSSRITLRDAAVLSQQEGSTVYVLNPNIVSIDSDAGPKTMQWLADVTGGRYLEANQEGTEGALSTVGRELRSLYAIGYKPRTAEPDGSFHQVSIIVPKKLLARHRHGYFAR